MTRFAVSLFLEKSDAGIVQQRLQMEVVKAANENEALGLMIRMDRRFKDFPILYHSVLEIEEQ